MKDVVYSPVVELEAEQPSAVVFSGDLGLGYFLAQELSNHDMSVALVLDKQRLTFDTNLLVQDLDNLTSLENFVGDYVFCIRPSLRPFSSFMAPLIELCRQRHTKLLIAEINDSQGQDLVRRIEKEADLDYRLVYLAPGYGPVVDPLSATGIMQLVVESLATKSINLPQDVQLTAYPTHYQDLARGLVLAMFKANTIKKVYCLGQLQALTPPELAVSLREALKLIDRSLNVNFSLSDFPWPTLDTQLVAYTQADLDWVPEIEFESGIREALSSLVTVVPEAPSESSFETPKIEESAEETASTLTTLPTEPPIVFKPPRLEPLVTTVPKRKRNWKPLMVISLVTLVLLTPLLSFILASSRGIAQLQSSIRLLAAGESAQAQKEAAASLQTLHISRAVVGLIRPLAFFKPEYPEKYDRLLDSATRMAGIVELMGETVEQLSSLHSLFLGEDLEIDRDSSLRLAKTNLEELYGQIGLVIASLDKVEFSSSLDYVSQLTELKQDLPAWQNTIKTGIHLLELWPELIGKDQKNLLIVIQNNAELRPTGGFIDGLALATFRQGRLVNVEYQDVFSLDKNLAGFVEPPAILKKYLGETNWFLRDANWDPDFSQSAEQIAWFYEKETGTKPDVVLALNMLTLKPLLEAIGPVELVAWNESITSHNLLDKILYLAKANPTPAGYPSLELVKVLGDKVTQHQVKLSDLAPALSQALEENQLSIYARDTQVQTQIKLLNWDGDLSSKPCLAAFANSGCVAETFALNEANIGINKVNLLVERSLSQKVNIDEKGKIEHQIEIEYRNLSSTVNWPGGDYRSFVRFYAPLGSQIQELSLNGVTLGLEETKLAGSGLQEYSFPLLVRAGETTVLKLGLRSPNILNLLSPESALTLNWEKQSGLAALPFRLSINYPQSLYPEAVNATTVNKPSEIQFLTQFSKDQTSAVSFKKTD